MSSVVNAVTSRGRRCLFLTVALSMLTVLLTATFTRFFWNNSYGSLLPTNVLPWRDSSDAKTTEFKVNTNYTWVKERQRALAEAAAAARKASNRSEAVVTKVLIVSYNRGGSSLFGELFNKLSKNSFYWFEPVDSFYMARYGFEPFSLPLALNTYFNERNYVETNLQHQNKHSTPSQLQRQDRGYDGSSERRDLTARILSADERMEMNEFLASLFSCDFRRIPIETFAHPFFKMSSFMSTTAECLQQFNSENETVQCKKIISEYCAGNADAQSRESRRPDMAVAERRLCSDIIRYFRSKRPTILSKEIVDDLNRNVPGALFDEHVDGTSGNISITTKVDGRTSSFQGVPVSSSSHLSPEARAKMFSDHFHCLDQLNKTVFEACIRPAEVSCRGKAEIIVSKVNRVHMSDIEPLLIRFPDLHVIHYVRDPRAMALSRVDARLELVRSALLNATGDSKMPPPTTGYNKLFHASAMLKVAAMTLESKHLCNRILSDIRARRRIETRFPGAISFVRYEDLIVDPVKRISDLLKRIRVKQPENTFYQYVRGTLFAGKEGGKFEVTRKNAMETAHKWKNRVSYQQAIDMSQHCSAVLKELGYEVWL